LTNTIRLVLNTHELARRLGYLALLVKHCTKPSEGTSLESASNCLNEKLKAMGERVNERACQFVVDYALKIGLLRGELQWSHRGYVINKYATDSLNLSGKARVVLLKYFLDGDGAFPILFLKELKEVYKKTGDGIVLADFLSPNEENQSGLERIFLRIVDTYMTIATELHQRHAMQTLARNAMQGYSNHVRIHKSLAHIDPLVDLGIIQRVDIPDKRKMGRTKYLPVLLKYKNERSNMVESFLQEFGDILELDEIMGPQGDFFKRASRLYNIPTEKINLGKHFGLLLNEILKAYETYRDDAFRLAPLSAVYDTVCVELLFPPNSKLCEQSDVSSAVSTLQSESCGGIRFHVDDWGVRNYLVISREYEEQLRKVKD